MSHHEEAIMNSCLQENLTRKGLAIYTLYQGCNERGNIVVRAHASHAVGLRFEPDSVP